MGQQYLRSVSISLNDGARVIRYHVDPKHGDDGLRIRFQCRQFVSSTPAHIVVQITNLSQQSITKFQKEYKKISFSAGYGDNEGLLFRGEIIQCRTYREDVTDVITEITATSGEKARNYAVVNKALAAGHTHDDRVRIATDAFKELGIEMGHIDSLGTTKFPRNFVAHGMAHDLLREICTAREARWFVHNGTFHLLKNEKTMPGGAIELNSSSGLVGIAEQTIEGVIFNCLLNPLIYPGCEVHINEKSVTRAAIDPSYTAGDRNALLAEDGLLGVAADGRYKVLRVEHAGDTRGNPFYTTGTGVSLGADSIALRAIGISDDIPN